MGLLVRLVLGVLSDVLLEAFQVNLGIGDVLDAETRGLFYGLKTAISCNIENLLVESDSAILVKLILHSDFSLHPLGSLLAFCKELMTKFQSISLSHIIESATWLRTLLPKIALIMPMALLLLINLCCIC